MEIVFLIVVRMNLDAVLKYLVKILNKRLMVSIVCQNQSFSSIKPCLSNQLPIYLNVSDQINLLNQYYKNESGGAVRRTQLPK